MLSRFVILALCIRVSVQAYAGGHVAYIGRAPIQLMGHKATSSVIAPQGFAGLVKRGSPASQKLVAMDASTMSPSTVPYFTVMPDETITLGDGQCVEAIGDQSGNTVRLNSCSDRAAQKWSWIPDGAGHNMIMLKDTSKCLAVSDSTFGSKEAPAIVLHECEQRGTNVWKFEEPSMPQPTLQSSASGFRNFVLSMMVLIGAGAVSLGAWSQHKRASSQRSPMDIEGGVALVMPQRSSSIVMESNLSKGEEEEKSALAITKDVVGAAGTQLTRFSKSNTAARLGDFGGWLLEKGREALDKAGASEKLASSVGKLEGKIDEGKFGKLKDGVVDTVQDLGERLKKDKVGDKLKATFEELTSEEARADYQRRWNDLQATETYKYVTAGAAELGSNLLDSAGSLLKQVGGGAQEKIGKGKLGSRLEDVKNTKGGNMTVEALAAFKEKVTSEEFKSDVSSSIETATPYVKKALVKLDELLVKFDKELMTKEKVLELQETASSVTQAIREAKEPVEEGKAASKKRTTDTKMHADLAMSRRTATPMMDSNLNLANTDDKSTLQITKDVLGGVGTQVDRFTKSNTAARLVDLGSWLVEKGRDLLANVGEEAMKNPNVQENVEQLQVQLDKLEATGNVGELKDGIFQSFNDLGDRLAKDNAGNNLLAKLEELTTEESIAEYKQNWENVQASETFQFVAEGAGELGSWIAENVEVLLEKVSDDVQTNLRKQKIIQDLESQLEELQSSEAYNMTCEAVTELKETVTSEDFKAEVARNVETATPYAKGALANLMTQLEEFDQKFMTREKVQELEASVFAVQEVFVEDIGSTGKFVEVASDPASKQKIMKFMPGRKFARETEGARVAAPVMDASLDSEEESTVLEKGVKVTKDVVSATATSIGRFTKTNTAARLGDVGGWLVGKVRDLLDNVGDKAKQNPEVRSRMKKLSGEVDELEATGNIGALGGKILNSVRELADKLNADEAGPKLLAKIDELTSPEGVKAFENGLAKVQATETYQFVAEGASKFGSWLFARTGKLLQKAGDALQNQSTVQKLGAKLEDVKSTKGGAAAAEALGNLKEKVTSEEFKEDVSRAIEKAKPVAKEALSKLEELLKKFDEKVMSEEGLSDLKAGATEIKETITSAGESTTKSKK